MRKLLIVKCVLLSFIVVTSAVYANEDQNVVENVIQRAYTSIARIEEGKIFLKPEKLCLMQGKIYIEDIDGAGFAIPVVFSSEGCPCVQVGESIIYNLWKCGECRRWNHKWENPTHCQYCDSPR